jgi:hypothetical protein
MQLAPLQRRAASVKSAGLAGIKTFKILVMENTKKNSFGNRTGSLAESCFTSDGGSISMAARAPGPAIWFFQDHQWKQRHNPSYKPQAPSRKSHAPIFRKPQATSIKHPKTQDASHKLQATSNKPHQA